MFDLLQILLFSTHIVSVGIGGVGPLFCIWLDWRGRRAGTHEAGDTIEHRLARQLAGWSIVLLVVGAVLGAAQLAVMWVGGDQYYFDLIGLIPTQRLWFGGIEWLFSIGCLVLYLWVQSRKPKLWYLHGSLVLLSATNSLYHFPVLFAVITVLGFEGAAAGDPQIKFTAYLFDEAVLLRTAHFFGAAVMVTSAFLMSLCLRAAKADEKSDASANTVIQQVGWLALFTVATEMILGISMLSVLPDVVQRALLGGNLLAASLFLASVIAVVGSLHHLGMICLGRCDQRHVTRLGAYLLLVVVLMSAARHMSHRVAWRQQPEDVTVTIQHPPEWQRAPSEQPSG